MSSSGGPGASHQLKSPYHQDLGGQQPRGSPKSSKASTVSTLSARRDDVASMTAAGSSGHATDATSAPVTPPTGHLANLESSANILSPHSYDMLHSAATQLLDLGCSAPGVPPNANAPQSAMLHPANHSSNHSIASPGSEGMSQDGIFLPGSAYLVFHSTLRNHTLNAARSAFPSRCGTPEHTDTVLATIRSEGQPPEACLPSNYHITDAVAPLGGMALSRPTPRTSELSQQEEFELWKNWVDEIGPWVSWSSRCKILTLDNGIVLWAHKRSSSTNLTTNGDSFASYHHWHESTPTCDTRCWHFQPGNWNENSQTGLLPVSVCTRKPFISFYRIYRQGLQLW
jgi:hypothetical protein